MSKTRYVVGKLPERPDKVMYAILHYAPETSVTGAPWYGRPCFLRTIGMDGVAE
jgi:hypothetical protein